MKQKETGKDIGEFFKCMVSQITERRVLGERAVNRVEHCWKIKLNAGKKDTIDFGNMEVFSDLGKRFWWVGKARLPMAEVNRELRYDAMTPIRPIPELCSRMHHLWFGNFQGSYSLSQC